METEEAFIIIHMPYDTVTGMDWHPISAGLTGPQEL